MGKVHESGVGRHGSKKVHEPEVGRHGSKKVHGPEVERHGSQKVHASGPVAEIHSKLVRITDPNTGEIRVARFGAHDPSLAATSPGYQEFAASVMAARAAALKVTNTSKTRAVIEAEEKTGPDSTKVKPEIQETFETAAQNIKNLLPSLTKEKQQKNTTSQPALLLNLQDKLHNIMPDFKEDRKLSRELAATIVARMYAKPTVIAEGESPKNAAATNTAQKIRGAGSSTGLSGDNRANMIRLVLDQIGEKGAYVKPSEDLFGKDNFIYEHALLNQQEKYNKFDYPNFTTLGELGKLNRQTGRRSPNNKYVEFNYLNTHNYLTGIKKKMNNNPISVNDDHVKSALEAVNKPNPFTPGTDEHKTYGYAVQDIINALHYGDTNILKYGYAQINKALNHITKAQAEVQAKQKNTGTLPPPAATAVDLLKQKIVNEQPKPKYTTPSNFKTLIETFNEKTKSHPRLKGELPLEIKHIDALTTLINNYDIHENIEISKNTTKTIPTDSYKQAIDAVIETFAGLSNKIIPPNRWSSVTEYIYTTPTKKQLITALNYIGDEKIAAINVSNYKEFQTALKNLVKLQESQAKNTGTLPPPAAPVAAPLPSTTVPVAEVSPSPAKNTSRQGKTLIKNPFYDPTPTSQTSSVYAEPIFKKSTASPAYANTSAKYANTGYIVPESGKSGKSGNNPVYLAIGNNPEKIEYQEQTEEARQRLKLYIPVVKSVTQKAENISNFRKQKRFESNKSYEKARQKYQSKKKFAKEKKNAFNAWTTKKEKEQAAKTIQAMALVTG